MPAGRDQSQRTGLSRICAGLTQGIVRREDVKLDELPGVHEGWTLRELKAECTGIFELVYMNHHLETSLPLTGFQLSPYFLDELCPALELLPKTCQVVEEDDKVGI